MRTSSRQQIAVAASLVLAVAITLALGAGRASASAQASATVQLAVAHAIVERGADRAGERADAAPAEPRSQANDAQITIVEIDAIAVSKTCAGASGARTACLGFAPIGACDLAARSARGPPLG